MFRWFIENIRGIHQEKKNQLKNEEEYWEFMIEDFNNRIQFTLTLGMIIGFIIGLSLTFFILYG